MAAINLAAAGFGSAEENAVQLGKAFSDVEAGLTALKRAGTLTREEIEDISSEFKATGNQGKAFERVLKALEVQSKNAAGATADGTKRIGVAWQLVKEEIGKPIAAAFEKFADDIVKNTPQILAAIEAMKPKIHEAATGLFTAISEAFQGDMDKLILIGRMIGDTIKQGLKLSLKGIGDILSESYIKYLESQKYNPLGALSRQRGGSEMLKKGNEWMMGVEMEKSINSIRENYAAMMQQLNQPSQSQQTQAVNNSKSLEINAMLEMNSILKDIKRNTEPHLFPSQ